MRNQSTSPIPGKMIGMTRLFLAIALLLPALPAQMLSEDALVIGLRQGGYTIVMRHASSPNAVPAGATERQLDESGKAAAALMGKTLRELKIPVGEVLSSPTQRALDTAKSAGWTQPVPTPALGDNGQSMSGGTAEQAEWLKARVKQAPKAGTNAVLITHMPNLRGAFPDIAAGVADGEALIFGTNGTIAGRMKIEDWPKLPK